MFRLFTLSAFLAFRAAAAVSQTTCKDPSVTWYNDDQGLNPCKQYETVRRYCDSGYEVPVLSVNTPGDQCDTQVRDCCCNSIAFALSMLCLNCQQGVGTGRPPDTGIDAGMGAYQIYLDQCGPGTNQSLPDTVQLAVCRNGPHLKRALYELFWGTGDWFLEFTRQRIDLEDAAGTSDPGKCPSPPAASTSSPTPLSVPVSTVAPPSTSNGGSSPTAAATTAGVAGSGLLSQPTTTSTGTSVSEAPPARNLNAGAIAGASVGSAVFMIAAVASIFLLCKHRLYGGRMSASQAREMVADPTVSPMVLFSAASSHAPSTSGVPSTFYPAPTTAMISTDLERRTTIQSTAPPEYAESPGGTGSSASAAAADTRDVKYLV